MKKERKHKRVLSGAEIFWIVFEGLFGAAGLTMIVLGFVADYLPVIYSDNALLQAQQKVMQATNGLLTFRWIGFILILAGTLIAVISLHFFAKKRDISDEREARRQQRMKIISDSVSEPEVVDAASKPVEEPAKASE